MPHSLPHPTDPDVPSTNRSLSAHPTYDPDISPSDPAAHPPLPKKKHVCQLCNRAFTTSGHLSRHTRIHTGERNHKCPFPGCETRCSRQDNLQQQSVPFPPSSGISPLPCHFPFLPRLSVSRPCTPTDASLQPLHSSYTT
ncbi:hypothetical protein C8Q77DRAFT_1049286 [Trametes polyzona]|nr:hypothetical protein C8Q77DRAFT_1049286 [Trametes polyzona]